MSRLVRRIVAAVSLRWRPAMVLAVVAGSALTTVVGAAPSRTTAPAPAPAPVPMAVPRRIISLVPATTEMLFAMGAGAQVVGVGSYDHFPAPVERLPRLGGLIDPSVERILALHPDLVVVYDSQADLRRQLDRAGIPQWGYRIQGLADVTATMRALGQRIGRAAEAHAAALAVEARLAAVRDRVAGRTRPRSLLVFGRDPGTLRGLDASGGYGFLHDLLELAGGQDVLGDMPRAAVTMSTEMLLGRAPEAIIEVRPGVPWDTARTEAERRVWWTLPSLPAVRTGRITLLWGDEFVVPGPRVALAAERLAAALHPLQAR